MSKADEPNETAPVKIEELFRAFQEATRAGDADALTLAEAALREALLAQAAEPAQPPPGAQREVAPIDWSTEPAPLFADGLQILHRATDFAVVFTDNAPFPGRRSRDGAPGSERAVVVASLRTHPSAFFQMVCAMASSWNRYATTMIDPRMRQPRFKLFDAGDLQLELAPTSAAKE